MEKCLILRKNISKVVVVYSSIVVGKFNKAKLLFKDGTSKIFDLPKPIESGVSLQVANSNNEFVN